VLSVWMANETTELPSGGTETKLTRPSYWHRDRPGPNVAASLETASRNVWCRANETGLPETMTETETEILEPDLQNILRQSYDYRTIMQALRSTYDGRLIYKTSYEERKIFLGYDSLGKS